MPRAKKPSGSHLPSILQKEVQYAAGLAPNYVLYGGGQEWEGPAKISVDLKRKQNALGYIQCLDGLMVEEEALVKGNPANVHQAYADLVQRCYATINRFRDQGEILPVDGKILRSGTGILCNDAAVNNMLRTRRREYEAEQKRVAKEEAMRQRQAEKEEAEKLRLEELERKEAEERKRAEEERTRKEAEAREARRIEREKKDAEWKVEYERREAERKRNEEEVEMKRKAKHDAWRKEGKNPEVEDTLEAIKRAEDKGRDTTYLNRHLNQLRGIQPSGRAQIVPKDDLSETGPEPPMQNDLLGDLISPSDPLAYYKKNGMLLKSDGSKKPSGARVVEVLSRSPSPIQEPRSCKAATARPAPVVQGGESRLHCADPELKGSLHDAMASKERDEGDVDWDNIDSFADLARAFERAVQKKQMEEQTAQQGGVSSSSTLVQGPKQDTVTSSRRPTMEEYLGMPLPPRISPDYGDGSTTEGVDEWDGQGEDTVPSSLADKSTCDTRIYVPSTPAGAGNKWDGQGKDTVPSSLPDESTRDTRIYAPSTPAGAVNDRDIQRERAVALANQIHDMLGDLAVKQGPRKDGKRKGYQVPNGKPVDEYGFPEVNINPGTLEDYFKRPKRAVHPVDLASASDPVKGNL